VRRTRRRRDAAFTSIETERLRLRRFSPGDVAAVRAVTDARNAPSIAVAERLGMRVVATVRTTFKAEPCEEKTYELTRGAWKARRS
jgi:RimJ/RimL family protein N-acetyltransferase